MRLEVRLEFVFGSKTEAAVSRLKSADCCCTTVAREQALTVSAAAAVTS